MHLYLIARFGVKIQGRNRMRSFRRWGSARGGRWVPFLPLPINSLLTAYQPSPDFRCCSKELSSARRDKKTTLRHIILSTFSLQVLRPCSVGGRSWRAVAMLG